MKGLTTGDWSLIARYLKSEASETDLVELDDLVTRHPELKSELKRMDQNVNPVDPEPPFDADRAFARLTQRFKDEDLL
ncbi:hypothetical protein [Chryseolinea lacunae]|uniref:Addiction module protein n=1 Tax=Chryseolinea lacunae TaxID=2801331 RepID=A0ABS1KZ16_9BACT|nr:hypothetical protein [Chryseolinea lacunae]MBL0744512.1 hypothetical protein [Chryseolinea lacunae]